MNRKYTASSVVESPRGRITLNILENGVIIGTAKRLAPYRVNGRRWILPFECKFNTDGCRNRFDDYCDSLSMGEVAEILYTNAKAK